MSCRQRFLIHRRINKKMTEQQIALKNLINKVAQDMELIQRGFTSMVLSEEPEQGTENERTVDDIVGVGDQRGART